MKKSGLPKWIIKRHTIYYIAVLIETEKFLTCVSIPNFARPIVATSDKSITRFVECAISKREQMSS
jgi:hypothetical protein